MIVVDTSALVAMLANEEKGPACRAVFEDEDTIYISAGTVAEALIVAIGRGFRPQMQELLESPAVVVLPLTADRAELVGNAYDLWGKRRHSATLNFGDCFAYAAAKELNCPLLYIGNDFSQTDVISAISASQA
ncbi:type II toxin-antitoxin system VapC family toxin [Rhizobium binxianense]